MRDRDIIEFKGTLVAATSRAMLVNIEGRDHWIPLSQLLGDGAEVRFAIYGWLVKRKGLRGKVVQPMGKGAQCVAALLREALAFIEKGGLDL